MQKRVREGRVGEVGTGDLGSKAPGSRKGAELRGTQRFDRFAIAIPTMTTIYIHIMNF